MYNPIETPITRRQDISIGNRIRFVYPEYSNDIEQTIIHLHLNKIYIIKDYNIYGEFIQIYLYGIDNVSFNSMQFVTDWSNYKIPVYSWKYIKYMFKKLNKKYFTCENQTNYNRLK